MRLWLRPLPASNARDRAKGAYNNAASASRETWIATATTDTYSGVASANWTSASTLSAAAREVTVEGLTYMFLSNVVQSPVSTKFGRPVSNYLQLGTYYLTALQLPAGSKSLIQRGRNGWRAFF